jgi:hypothetical protein
MSKLELALDILAGEADESYYLQWEGKEIAEKPVAMILRKGHPLGNSRHWTIWFNGLARFYGSEKEVRARLENMLAGAKKPLTVWVKKYGRAMKVYRSADSKGEKESHDPD